MDPTEEHEPEAHLTRRARRVVTLIATSLAVIVVASLLYLHRKIGGEPKPPAAVPTPSPKLIHDRYFADFTFVTPTLGWALVESPTTPQHWIYKTSDGGKHWTSQNLPPYSIQSLTFSDPSHGWLIGWTQTTPASSANTVYHYESTADGGKTWSALPSPPLVKKLPGFAITGLNFRTATEGWNVAYESLGVIDAKHAWARVSSQNPKRRGYGLALTSDGGAHWTYANVPNPP